MCGGSGHPMEVQRTPKRGSLTARDQFLLLNAPTGKESERQAERAGS